MADALSSTRLLPMRIVLGCDAFPPDINGASTFSANLAAGLTGRGHEVHVVAPAFNGRTGQWAEVHNDVELIVHRVRSWRWYPHSWFRFVPTWVASPIADRILRQVKPDVVHIQSSAFLGAALSFSATARKIRLIATNHLMPALLPLWLLVLPRFASDLVITIVERGMQRTYGRADVLTTPTRRAADFLEKSTGLFGTLAVSNGVDLSRFTSDFTPRRRNRIVFLGRLAEEKHVEELIAAVARMDPALDVEVDIVGDGELRRILEHGARSLQLSDRVNFHGKLDDEDVRQLLTEGAVFVMPSRSELQGVAILEAMASGLPVVAANAMAIPHLVHPAENGYLYEPGDIDGLARYLTLVLTAPPAEYQRLKRESLRIVAAHSLERTLDSFEALYAGELLRPDLIDGSDGFEVPLAAGPSSPAEELVAMLDPANLGPVSTAARRWLARLPTDKA